mgnify:CR=1 FL=1
MMDKTLVRHLSGVMQTYNDLFLKRIRSIKKEFHRLLNSYCNHSRKGLKTVVAKIGAEKIR